MADQGTSPPLVKMWQDNYSDMPFADFAQKVWQKNYSDMPFETFAARTQIAKVDNGGFGTRAQREPDTVTDSNGQTVNTIPYSEGLAKAQKEMKGESGFSSFMMGAGGHVIPGSDKLAAGIGSLTDPQGQNWNYNDYLAFVRGQQDARSQAHPVASAAGTGTGMVAGALIAPQLNVAKAGAIGNAALNGALYGGVSGAIENDGGVADKARAAAMGATIGGAGGAALGAAGAGLGRLAGRSAQPIATAGNDAVEAATRQGITIPNIAATDSPIVQRAGQAINGTFAGAPIGNAVGQGIEDLGGAVQSVAGRAGNAGEASVVGGNLQAGLQDFVKTGSQIPVRKAYGDLEAMVPAGARADMPATVAEIQDIAARRAAAGLPGEGAAANRVLELATRPQGATPSGIKDLRTNLGEMTSRGVLPADFSGAEAKRLYGSMTQDLRGAYGSVGGPKAAQQFDVANAMAARVAQRNEELAAKLLKNGQSGENVFQTVAAAARTGGRENTKLLLQVKSAVPQQQWNDFTASVIHNMGRAPDGTFSADRFLTDATKLSQAGKNILFTQAQRDALDDLAKVAERYKNLGKMENRSRTGNVASLLGAGSGIMVAPITTLSTALGGNIMARMLARPAAVRGMSNWSHAYGRFVQSANMANAKALQTQTKAFALVVAREIGDTKQAAAIEQNLLNVPLISPPPHRK